MERTTINRYSSLAARWHRWLVCIAIVLGFAALPWYAAAGPLPAPMEVAGGDTSLYPQDNQEETAARLFNEVLSQRATEVCALLMATGAVTHTPLGEYVGPIGFEEYVAGAWSAFPDAKFTINATESSADHLTVHWTMIGRHLGDFESLPASGAIVRLDGIAILQFQDGMISQSWLQYDRMSLVEQIESSADDPEICPPCDLP